MKYDTTIYDTTLRDGMQGVGAHFTVEDKLRIAALLDRMGISYIEGGSPGFNPKDAEFFGRVGELDLKNASIVAFGSTMKFGGAPDEDDGLKALGDCSAACVCIFGKAWKLHVHNVLDISEEDNLAIISQSIAYLRQRGKTVFFDAEHFFDGYKDDSAYALKVVECAFAAGAEMVYLCDTNGGSLPSEISAIMKDSSLAKYGRLGIHTHNDSGLATANAVAAVENGAVSVQTTLTGIGERCAPLLIHLYFSPFPQGP